MWSERKHIVRPQTMHSSPQPQNNVSRDGVEAAGFLDKLFSEFLKCVGTE